VNPLEKPVLDVPEEPEAEDTEGSESAEAAEEENKRSTLSRTTDWIIKNIARVGHSDEHDPEQAATDPADELAEGDQLEARGGQTSSWPERLQNSSRAQARFELVGDDGSHHTLGEAPGALGSAQTAPEGEPGQWIWVLADDSSVDPLHLRFGVEDGLFWVEDNNSIIGTVIEEPGRQALQCVPHERYFLVRGSSVTVGTVRLSLQ
jgi:hypothetical protein